MADIMKTLKSLDEFKRYNQMPAGIEYGGNQSFPTIVVWRYTNPTQNLAMKLKEIISSFQGQVTWELTITDDYWLLAPRRFTEYSKLHNNIGILDAAIELANSDSGFGECANAEIELLA